MGTLMMCSNVFNRSGKITFSGKRVMAHKFGTRIGLIKDFWRYIFVQKQGNCISMKIEFKKVKETPNFRCCQEYEGQL